MNKVAGDIEPEAHPLRFRASLKRLAKTLTPLAVLVLLAGCSSLGFPPGPLAEADADLASVERKLVSLDRQPPPSASDHSPPQETDSVGCGANRPWHYDGFKLGNHLIISDSNGYLRNHGGDIDKAMAALFSGIAAWRDLHPGRKLRLMFYFNGGLNPEQAVIRQAVDQVPCILADGIYPVYFVWDTSAVPSYLEQIFYLRDGQQTYRPQYGTGGIYAGGDLTEGLGRTLSDVAARARRNLAGDRPCLDLLLPQSDANHCGAQSPAGWISIQSSLSGREQWPGVSAERNILIDMAAVDNASANFGLDTLRSYVLAPVRVFTTPAADGLGKTTWDNYVRRTRTTIRKTAEFDLRLAENPNFGCHSSLQAEMRDFPQGTGAFAKVFHLLSLHRQGRQLPHASTRCVVRTGSTTMRYVDVPAGPLPQLPRGLNFRNLDFGITLIGHSMGAIAINELLARFKDDLPIDDVVFMAGAASIRESQRSVEPFLAQNPNARFYNLMLHPINDRDERSFGDTVPSGSLLFWVDEMYEQPKTPPDKTIGYWTNMRPARIVFDRRVTGDRILYRVFNRAPAATSTPLTHGSFNDTAMCFWRPAFWGAAQVNWRRRYSDMPRQALTECRG